MHRYVRWITFFAMILIGVSGFGAPKSKAKPKANNSNITETFNFTVTKVAPGTVRLNIIPTIQYPGRIYSLSLFHADEKIAFPIPNNPTEHEKDGAIFIALEETIDGNLTSPFYKTRLLETGKFENPFSKLPITDLNADPIGSRATGILYYMVRKSGKGVITTSSGKGKIPWKEGEGYSFLIHFKTDVPEWKMLLSIVRVEVFRPLLKNPTLSPVFNVS